MTGFATLAIVIAAVLLVIVVLVPRYREGAGLPSTFLALVGAIVARFTAQNTMFGDQVFRGSTVYWSVALALTSAMWWYVASAKNKPRPAPPVVHKPSLSSGESTSSVAVKSRPTTATAQAAPTAQAAQSTRRTRSKRSTLPALFLCGAVSIAIAATTFLTATGIYPITLPL